MNQTESILRALKTGRRITPLSALFDFDCLRLGARVWDLKQRGYDIRRVMKEVSSGKSVAEYFLEQA